MCPKGHALLFEKMAKKKIQEYIAEYMEDFGKENGYELSRCEFLKEGQSWYLRVYCDKLVDGVYDYMGSEDCKTISYYLSERLDEDDPIEQNYILEVSSPGMDRPLISEKDFVRFTGSQVEVKLYEAVDGRKKFQAELKGLKDGIVSLELEDGTALEIAKDKISKINLAVIF